MLAMTQPARLWKIGVVSEGPTDFLVLKAVIGELLGEQPVEFRRIHPDEIMISPFGNGWRGVQRWCQEYGPTLESFMRDIPSDMLDLLVVHVDGSVAGEQDISVAKPCPPPRPTADALREVISRDWLQRPSLPSFVVLATPMVDTETWVVSAVAPPEMALCECDPKAWRTLVELKLLGTKDGKLKKNQAAYRPLAEAVGKELARVRTTCTEAERFCEDFRVNINSNFQP